MISFAITAALLAAYFLYMSYEDAKSKTVPVYPSNLLIFGLFGMYLANCLGHRVAPDAIALVVGTAVTLLFVKRRMFLGSADAKALFVCFLASPFISTISSKTFCFGSLSAFVPALVYLFAAIPFIGYCVADGMRRKLPVKKIFLGSGERHAFFPFLTIGFLSYILLIIATNLF